jgi:AcrR family transcriptional regulator
MSGAGRSGGGISGATTSRGESGTSGRGKLRAGSEGTKRGETRASGRGRSAGASWTKNPEGRRQRVLDEATTLFATRGFAKVSTGDIARAAGVAEGSVFHYFGSKQELLRAVGERYGAEFAAAMFDGVDAVASPATVREVVARAFDFVEKSWPGFGLFLLSDDPSAAPLAQKANRDVVTKAVEAVLEAWGRGGAIARVDASVVADLLFGLVEAGLRGCFAGGGGERRKRYEAATVSAISSILRLE